MSRLILLFLLPFLFLSCQRDSARDGQEILLTEDIFNLMNERVQVRYDTINGEVVRSFHLLPEEDNIAKLLNNDRVKIMLPAADVSLGDDTVRIGIMRVVDWDSTFARGDYSSFPDHLFITHAGTEATSFVLDQANIRPITNRTVFRVGRNHYLLKSVDSLLTRLVVQSIEPHHSIPLSAEFDLKYRRVNVVDLDNRPTTIPHTKGKRMAICFTGIHDWADSGLLDMNALGGQTQVQNLWDFAFINHSHSTGTIREQAAELGVDIPFYKSTTGTCSTLNCRPNLPYCIEIDTAGNVVSYFRGMREMTGIIRQSVPGTPLAPPAASSSSRRRP